MFIPVVSKFQGILKYILSKDITDDCFQLQGKKFRKLFLLILLLTSPSTNHRLLFKEGTTGNQARCINPRRSTRRPKCSAARTRAAQPIDSWPGFGPTSTWRLPISGLLVARKLASRVLDGEWEKLVVHLLVGVEAHRHASPNRQRVPAARCTQGFARFIFDLVLVSRREPQQRQHWPPRRRQRSRTISVAAISFTYQGIYRLWQQQ